MTDDQKGMLVGLALFMSVAIPLFFLGGFWYALIGPNDYATDFRCWGMPGDCVQLDKTVESIKAWQDQGGRGLPPEGWQPEKR